jgi:hypothetical protein
MLIRDGNVLKTAVAVGATTGQVLRVGLHGQTTATTQPVSGVWWEADPAVSANWRYCYGTGSAAVCAASTTPIAADSWARLAIRVTATGTNTSAASFVIDGSAWGVGGVTIDTTNRIAPAYSCYTTTATARDCYWDYFQLFGTTAAR